MNSSTGDPHNRPCLFIHEMGVFTSIRRKEMCRVPSGYINIQSCLLSGAYKTNSLFPLLSLSNIRLSISKTSTRRSLPHFLSRMKNRQSNCHVWTSQCARKSMTKSPADANLVTLHLVKFLLRIRKTRNYHMCRPQDSKDRTPVVCVELSALLFLQSFRPRSRT
jgi:hypothetical protein